MQSKPLPRKQTPAPTTIGTVVLVDLPELYTYNLKAKVDTGAFSGALHATGIREITAKDGKKRLEFLPLGKGKLVQVDQYHQRLVRSSSGHTSLRYAFKTTIEVLGEAYHITITLSNRGDMRYAMLIGRNFLRKQGFVVDVNYRNH